MKTAMSPEIDLSRYSFFSFDCYGTLIDWESGLLAALRPIFAAHNVAASDARILAAYAELERDAEAGPYQRYRRILEGIVRDLGARFGFTPTQSQCESLPASIVNWPAFPDTAESLRRLKRHMRVGILSNIDDDLFAGSAPRLGIDFDLVVTAQQAGAYKPSLRNFDLMRRRLIAAGIAPEQWIHAGQSRAHDIVPALALALANILVDRPMAYGASAVTTAEAQPDCTVLSLAALADLFERGR